jgi:NAD+ synthase
MYVNLVGTLKGGVSKAMGFSKECIEIDPAAESERIVTSLRQNVLKTMRRQGAVVGISGGVDSSVVLSLSV